MAPPSHSPILTFAAHVFGIIFIGFGLNAILRPAHALTFFEFELPSQPTERKVVEALSIIYGARDIFMGVAIVVSAANGGGGGGRGGEKVAGWILIAASVVAFVDGLVCWGHRGGEWNHWGYAPMVGVVGGLLVGVADRA